MADITMCDGIVHEDSKAPDCPLRRACYRYRAYPSEYRQSFFIVAPWDGKGEPCEQFWDLQGRTDLTDKN